MFYGSTAVRLVLTVFTATLILGSPTSAQVVASTTITDEQSAASESSQEQSGHSGMEGLQARDLPADAYGDPQRGVPVRRLFRDTGAPFRDPVSRSPITAQPKLGSVEGSGRFEVPHFRVGSDLLRRGFEPADAHLKLGSVYLRFTNVSGSILVSDNVERSNEDRETDAIAILSLGMLASGNITEGLRLNLAATLAWLPFEGKAGIDGLGLVAPYFYSLDYAPLIQGQLAYDTVIAGWPVTFGEEFSVRTGSFMDGSRDYYEAFEGFECEEEDRAGRYVFRNRLYEDGRTESDRDRDLDTDVTYFSNVVSATTVRDLPPEVRFRAGAYHQNLIYLSGDEVTDDLATRIDAVNVSAESTRENLRFKPFARYRFTDTDRSQGSYHKITVGARGPITDQLSIWSSLGYYFNTSGNSEGVLWDLGLEHVAGPLTSQAFRVRRALDELNDTVADQISYQLQQILGKDLTAEINVSQYWFEDVSGDRNAADYSSFRIGARVTWVVSPKTNMRLSALYADNSYTRFDTETFSLRYEISHNFTDTFTSRLFYQYSQRDSSREDRSYWENAVFLNLTKYFR